MPANNNRKEYIDIPIAIEETPQHLFEKFQPPAPPTESLELALDFITHIDNAIRSSECSQQLLPLYFNYFEFTNSKYFAEKEWPPVHEIQGQYEDKDFSAKVQTLYNQLRMRNKFAKIKKTEISAYADMAEQSWQYYESIFEREGKQINFPHMVIWDIFENFLLQCTKYHETKFNHENKKQFSDDAFPLDRIHELLDDLINFMPKQPTKNPSSKESFGYFALLTKAVLLVHANKYKQALNVISILSLQHLSAYSKAIGGLLTLLNIAGYSYFMLQQYQQAARLTELALLFYQKNKKYFSHPTIEKQTSPLFEKLSTLLCLSYIFLEQKPKPIMMELFKNISIKKDKNHKEKLSDKYYRLKQNDSVTFNKLVQIILLPSTHQTSNQAYEIVSGRFKQLQNITINTILQHYTQISVKKIAQMLNINESQISGLIESYNNVSTGSTSWDNTIMGPLLSHTTKLQIEVVDGVVQLDTEQTNQSGFEWEQYHEEIGWLNEKVNAL